MADLTGEPDFEEFWAAYPRKVGKAAARKSWDTAVIKIKIAPADIVAGARRYATAKRGTEIQYVAHASTWLNQQRWTDEHVGGGEVEAEERPHVRDEAAVGVIAATKRAQQIRARIIQATRERHSLAIQEAARRLNALESELWNCMCSGSIGFEARAWKFACEEAVGGTPAPESLNVEREHWVDGKDRLETRRRVVPQMRQQATSLLT
jgi:hypothetical protein